jgi:indolepyruvate decarboxylase
MAQWHYADLPKALGCDNWFTARVTTCKEFDQPLTEHPRPRSQNF